GSAPYCCCVPDAVLDSRTRRLDMGPGISPVFFECLLGCARCLGSGALARAVAGRLYFFCRYCARHLYYRLRLRAHRDRNTGNSGLWVGTEEKALVAVDRLPGRLGQLCCALFSGLHLSRVLGDLARPPSSARAGQLLRHLYWLPLLDQDCCL